MFLLLAIASLSSATLYDIECTWDDAGTLGIPQVDGGPVGRIRRVLSTNYAHNGKWDPELRLRISEEQCAERVAADPGAVFYTFDRSRIDPRIFEVCWIYTTSPREFFIQNWVVAGEIQTLDSDPAGGLPLGVEIASWEPWVQFQNVIASQICDRDDCGHCTWRDAPSLGWPRDAEGNSIAYVLHRYTDVFANVPMPTVADCQRNCEKIPVTQALGYNNHDCYCFLNSKDVSDLEGVNFFAAFIDDNVVTDPTRIEVVPFGHIGVAKRKRSCEYIPVEEECEPRTEASTQSEASLATENERLTKANKALREAVASLN